MEHDTGSLGWLFSELFQTDKVRKINSFFDAAVIDLVHICPAHMRVLHSCGTHVLHTCMSCTHACLAHMCVLRTCVSFTHACFAFMRDCVTRVMHTCLSCIHACPTYMRVLHTCVSYIHVCPTYLYVCSYKHGSWTTWVTFLICFCLRGGGSGPIDGEHLMWSLCLNLYSALKCFSACLLFLLETNSFMMRRGLNHRLSGLQHGLILEGLDIMRVRMTSNQFMY